MVYPADDLLLRARLVRKAAQERARPTCALLHEITGLISEVEARARENATSEGASPPPPEMVRSNER
jgi:dienelactone hydrolase